MSHPKAQISLNGIHSCEYVHMYMEMYIGIVELRVNGITYI